MFQLLIYLDSALIWSAGSGSALGTRFRFQEWQKLPNKIEKGEEISCNFEVLPVVTVAPMRGIYLHLKTVLQRTCVFYIRNMIEIKYPAFEFSLTKYFVLSALKVNFPPFVSQSFFWFFNFFFTVDKDSYQRPQRPR